MRNKNRIEFEARMAMIDRLGLEITEFTVKCKRHYPGETKKLNREELAAHVLQHEVEDLPEL